VADPQHRALARLALRRVAVPRGDAAPRSEAPRIVSEPWPPSEPPYSRTLWGSFLPDRRAGRSTPPGGLERRRG
jgi:hypothetical protein